MFIYIRAARLIGSKVNKPLSPTWMVPFDCALFWAVLKLSSRYCSRTEASSPVEDGIPRRPPCLLRDRSGPETTCTSSGEPPGVIGAGMPFPRVLVFGVALLGSRKERIRVRAARMFCVSGAERCLLRQRVMPKRGRSPTRPEVWAERGFALLFEIEIQFIWASGCFDKKRVGCG